MLDDKSIQQGAVRQILVLGIGNSIMSDDGAGPAVIASLNAGGAPTAVSLVDGGTCGLALLPHIEDATALIVVDAVCVGKAPGTVTVFEGEDMHTAFRDAKQTAHEVSLSDLLDAARATGALPSRRALVAIEPERIAVGAELSPQVGAAVARASAAVETLIGRWIDA